MNTTATSYKLKEAEQQMRLEDFRKGELASLESEIALGRAMLENAKNSGNVLLARDLLGVIGGLVRSHRQAREREGELLDKAAVVQLGREILQILDEEFAGTNGHAERMDRATDRLFAAIAAAKNETESKS
jgi:hypothetical protein